MRKAEVRRGSRVLNKENFIWVVLQDKISYSSQIIRGHMTPVKSTVRGHMTLVVDFVGFGSKNS